MKRRDASFQSKFRKMYKLIAAMLVFLFINSLSFSQVKDLCVPVKNDRALQIYDEAINIIHYDYRQGYALLQEAINIEPYFVQAFYTLGIINYEKAIKESSDGIVPKNSRSIWDIFSIIGAGSSPCTRLRTR